MRLGRRPLELQAEPGNRRDPLFELLIPTPRPSEDGAIESIVAAALFRSAASVLVQAGAIPGAVGYWRSSQDREIDFVVPRSSEPENPRRFPLEVKGDDAAGISNARSAIKRRFEQGIVVSRSRFEWAPDVAVLPAWMLLAGLRENPYRPMTIG